MFKWLRTMRDLRYFAKLGIPVFLNKNGDICLRKESGPNPDPVITVSVPKSGTYLFAEVLAALGVQRLDIHIDVTGFMDLRYCTNEFAIGHDDETFVKVPYDRILPIVHPGQFMVSHFHCTPEIINNLKRFKVIFTCRDMRDVFASIMRYVAKQRKTGNKPDEGWENLPDGPAKMEKFIERYGEHYISYIKKMRDWAAEPGVFSMTFEEVQGDFGPLEQIQSLRRLADFLGLKRSDAELRQALQKSIGKETITYSGKRTSRTSLWSDKVEDFFVKNGGVDLEQFWAKHVSSFQQKKLAG
jgi:sulfotransferase family protein